MANLDNTNNTRHWRCIIVMDVKPTALAQRIYKCNNDTMQLCYFHICWQFFTLTPRSQIPIRQMPAAPYFCQWSRLNKWSTLCSPILCSSVWAKQRKEWRYQRKHVTKISFQFLHIIDYRIVRKYLTSKSTILMRREAQGIDTLERRPWTEIDTTWQQTSNDKHIPFACIDRICVRIDKGEWILGHPKRSDCYWIASVKVP